MASAYGWGAAGLAGVGLFCFACSSDSDGSTSSTSSSSGAPSNTDGGILDSAVQNVTDASEGGSTVAPRTVTVKTTASSTSLAPGGPANATIAAYLADDGTTWTPLTATSTGVYSFTSALTRWSAVFICSDDSDNTTIDTYERSVTELDVRLGGPCTLPQATTAVELQGTFTNLPNTTLWFDFAYAWDDRGSVLPPDGASFPYDLPTIQKGTWDLIFGFRDNDGEPLTKLYIARQQNLGADLELDADISTAGFTPTPHTITVTGATAAETLNAPILYTVGSGAQHGVDVGPQQPSVAAATSFTYDSVPAASQQAGDLYVASIATDGATTSTGATTSRGMEGTFHTAVDFPVTLPAAIASVSAFEATSKPYSRIVFQFAGRAAATHYLVTTSTRITDQVSHDWSYDTDEAVADGATISIGMPDLSALAGFKTTWAPDPTDSTATATITEATVTVSDGTLAPFSTISETMGQ